MPFGGGIYNDSATVTLTDVTVSHNSALEGGGIYSNRGETTLTNSTVSGNRVYGNGGGIYGFDATLTLTNTVVSVNLAVGEFSSGGGVYCDPGAVTLTNSTVSSNYAIQVGGGIWAAGTLTLNNTVVVLNSARDGFDVAGAFTGNNSLVGGMEPLFVRNPSDGSDGWGDDPRTPSYDESANDDYGDLRLLPGSPAIDGGDNALLPADEFDLDGDGNVAEPLPVDLAGGRRVLGPRVDIGAYEGAVVVAEVFGDSVDALVASGDMELGEGARLELVIGGGGDEFEAGEYTLIEAAGGLTGTFASVTDLGGYVSTNGDGLTYDEVAGTVSLTLDRDLNPGDANLDCATDVSDRIIWNTNNFTAGTTFITGDFDGDGVTDVSDRIIWNSNNFTVATAAPAPRATAGALAAVFPADTEDVPAAAGVSAAPTAEQMPVVRSTLADATGSFAIGVAGAGDEASLGIRTDGLPRWVAADDVTVSAVQLEVDLGVGLAGPV